MYKEVDMDKKDNVLLFFDEKDPIRQERLKNITEFDHSTEMPSSQTLEKLAKDIEDGINNGTILSWLKDFDEE
jgi:hypothetical protein